MIAFPNCKINIGLNVLAKRNDGFHNIETVLYPVPWCDVLEIIPSKTGTTRLHTSGIEMDMTPEKNICYKAYQLLSQDFDLSPADIFLHKIIPFGAGLGGGSSDAVSTIILLDKVFQLKMSESKKIEYASALGSDCSFFVRNKPCFASGRGEKLAETNLSLKGYWIVIIKPDFNISTAEAYSLVKPAKPDLALADLIKLPVTEWQYCIMNDFEKPLFEKYPLLDEIKKSLYKEGAVYASMSGSGSAVYGLFSSGRVVEGLKKFEKFEGMLE